MNTSTLMALTSFSGIALGYLEKYSIIAGMNHDLLKMVG